MKLLTKHSDYAIRALIELSRNKNSYSSSREIAQKQGIPYQFLRRILRELIRNKLIISKNGGGGGFRIKVNPENINIVNVIKIFQGNLQLADCMFRKKICPNRSICILRREVKRVEKIVEKEFNKITLARLLGKTRS